MLSRVFLSQWRNQGETENQLVSVHLLDTICHMQLNQLMLTCGKWCKSMQLKTILNSWNKNEAKFVYWLIFVLKKLLSTLTVELIDLHSLEWGIRFRSSATYHHHNSQEVVNSYSHLVSYGKRCREMEHYVIKKPPFFNLNTSQFALLEPNQDSQQLMCLSNYNVLLALERLVD